MSWSTKVRHILGSGFEFITEERTRETTIKDLLSHRTGLSGLVLGILAGYPRNFTRKHCPGNLLAGASVFK